MVGWDGKMRLVKAQSGGGVTNFWLEIFFFVARRAHSNRLRSTCNISASTEPILSNDGSFDLY